VLRRGRGLLRVTELQLNDPQTLYRRWEDSQWSPWQVDLEIDKEQWPTLTDERRGLIYFVLSSLMVAEERITTKFSGLVGAHGSEEEATFLSTQQVDEARHMQFYARFQDEVVAEPAGIAAHVERARGSVSDAFRELFDVQLVDAHDKLVAAPGDLAAKVRFVTLYHLVLEGTLGLTSFRFITDYLNDHGLLPGFVEGYSLIHHDETRHIGFGVWWLRETVGAHEEAANVVRQTLRHLLPHVAESLKLPGNGDASAILGVSEDDLRQFALTGLTRRLQIIGVPLETVLPDRPNLGRGEKP
jgi:ribonucleoside-diphosphate reductase beta chain